MHRLDSDIVGILLTGSTTYDIVVVDKAEVRRTVMISGVICY